MKRNIKFNLSKHRVYNEKKRLYREQLKSFRKSQPNKLRSTTNCESNTKEETLFCYRRRVMPERGYLAMMLPQRIGLRGEEEHVSRVLKRNKWTRKEIRRISMDRSETLRRAYLDDIRRFLAVDLIFLDESIFNELADATILMPLLAMKRDTMLIYSVEEPGVYVLP
jgi:hypothetical protein